MKVIREKASKLALFLGFCVLFVSCSQYENNFKEPNSTINPTQIVKKINNESGIDIFKSIFFGLGNLANNIQLLKSQVELTNNLNPEKTKEVTGKLDVLIEKISTKYPGFFEDFKKKITSGEQLQIKIAIEEGSIVIKENIEIILPEFKKVFKKVKSDISSGKLIFNENDNFNDYVETFQNAFDKGEYDNLLNENMISDNQEQLLPCSWAIACVLYFALAVHNTLAITALIYFKFAFWGPSINKKNQIVGSYRPTNEIEDNLKTETLINEISEYYAKN